jgi:hypothetical protein
MLYLLILVTIFSVKYECIALNERLLHDYIKLERSISKNEHLLNKGRVQELTKAGIQQKGVNDAVLPLLNSLASLEATVMLCRSYVVLKQDLIDSLADNLKDYEIPNEINSILRYRIKLLHAITGKKSDDRDDMKTVLSKIRIKLPWKECVDLLHFQFDKNFVGEFFKPLDKEWEILFLLHLYPDEPFFFEKLFFLQLEKDRIFFLNCLILAVYGFFDKFDKGKGVSISSDGVNNLSWQTSIVHWVLNYYSPPSSRADS